MTLSESPDEQWQRHLPAVEILWDNSLPRVRPKRFASLVSLPLAFAIVTCFSPLRESSPVLATPKKVAQQTTEELEAILKTLEEAEVLNEEAKQKLQEELKKFAEETHDQPLTHEQWETADSLKQQMQMLWEKNERSIESASSALNELLSEMANNGELSADQLQQLEQALEKNLQAMAQKACQGNCEGMSDALKNAMQNLSKSGKMNLPGDADERQKMLEELKKQLEQESERLAKQRSECQGLCQGDGQCEGDQPGSGGVSRGPGAAEMMWGKESDLAGTKFKEMILPRGLSDEPGEQILGITSSEPEVDPATSAPRQALRETDPAAGRATWDRKLNPRHRNVVRKFFDSQRPEQPLGDDGEI